MMKVSAFAAEVCAERSVQANYLKKKDDEYLNHNHAMTMHQSGFTWTFPHITSDFYVV